MMKKAKGFKVGQLVELRDGARMFVMHAKYTGFGDVSYRLAPELDDPEEDWMGWYGEFCDGMKAVPATEPGR